jgi:hypothetical protein
MNKQITVKFNYYSFAIDHYCEKFNIPKSNKPKGFDFESGAVICLNNAFIQSNSDLIKGFDIKDIFLGEEFIDSSKEETTLTMCYTINYTNLCKLNSDCFSKQHPYRYVDGKENEVKKKFSSFLQKILIHYTQSCKCLIWEYRIDYSDCPYFMPEDYFARNSFEILDITDENK